MTRPKLTFIGRQYHSKTQSDQMILSLLESHFEVQILRREQYSDRELVSAINQFNPDVVFYWCLPPSTTKQLWKLTCKNIVWAPMWDGFKPLGFRKRMLLVYSKVKVLCFSKALHEYFLTTKMQTRYWQCGLKPSFKNFKEKPPYTLFLWQREALINLDRMVALLGEENIEKVLYKSEIGVLPHKKYPFEVEKLKDWMPRDEYEKKMEEADFFVAPRRAEGIGFSFLEAMSLGKVILAYNESTMNEYLFDGENGYLFDENFKLSQPLKAPEDLSKRMYELAQKTYENWEESKHQIIPFLIEKK